MDSQSPPAEQAASEVAVANMDKYDRTVLRMLWLVVFLALIYVCAACDQVPRAARLEDGVTYSDLGLVPHLGRVYRIETADAICYSVADGVSCIKKDTK